MAFDYKALQALAASNPPDADDYCPECGRPWIVTAPEHPQDSGPRRWRAALLVSVGLLLVLSFGLRSRSVNGKLTHDPVVLREALTCFVVTSESKLVACESANGETYKYSTPGLLLLHDLLVMASGAALVLVGFGVLIRPHFRARSRLRLSFVIACWTVGETLSFLVCLLILALYADLAIVRLSLGWPLTLWDAVDPITDQVSSLLSLITGF